MRKVYLIVDKDGIIKGEFTNKADRDVAIMKYTYGFPMEKKVI